MKPIGVKNGEAAIVTFEDMFQQAEDLELRLQAMTEHMEELTEEFGYKPSMTMEERIEAKRFLKKLSGK